MEAKVSSRTDPGRVLFDSGSRLELHDANNEGKWWRSLRAFWFLLVGPFTVGMLPISSTDLPSFEFSVFPSRLDFFPHWPQNQEKRNNKNHFLASPWILGDCTPWASDGKESVRRETHQFVSSVPCFSLATLLEVHLCFSNSTVFFRKSHKRVALPSFPLV